MCQGLKDWERFVTVCECVHALVCVLMIFMQLSQPTGTITQNNDNFMAYDAQCNTLFIHW